MEKKSPLVGKLLLKLSQETCARKSAFSEHMETHVFRAVWGMNAEREASPRGDLRAALESGGSVWSARRSDSPAAEAGAAPGGSAASLPLRRAVQHPAQGALPGQGSPGRLALPRRAWPALEGAELWPPVR